MKRLSIVGKNFQRGSLWGMLFGSAFFFIPAIGPLVVMGPLVSWIVGGLEGAVVGGAAGALGGALTSIGIPKDSVVKYELAVKGGKYLVLARGSADMIEHARAVLGTTGASDLTAHFG